MLFPFGDYPNPRQPQWVTRILVAVNVAVHLFVAVPLEQRRVTPQDLDVPATREVVAEMWSAQRDRVEEQYAEDLRRGRISRMPDDREMYRAWLSTLTHYSLFTQEYGYKPGAASLLTLFACMFLHGGWMHLLGNMVYLWIFGDNIEARLGPGKYLAAYLGTGVAATLAFSLFARGSMIPLVGASGAISGILGFYLVWFPHNQVRVFVFYFFITVVHVRALWVLGMFLLLDFIPVLLGQQTGVAHGAHLGGFAAGMGLAWLWNAVRGAVPPPRPQPYVSGRGTPWRPPPIGRPQVAEQAGAAFDEAIRAGRMEDAAHAFARLLREGGATPAAAHVFSLARWLYENRFIADAAAVFRYYIRSYPTGADLDLVHLGLGILLARHLAQPAAAREHLLQAIDLAGSDSRTAATAREELARL